MQKGEIWRVLIPAAPGHAQSSMLLPESSEQQVDSEFTGVLGAFEIYRGSTRGHRMANLRIILR